MNPVAGPFVPQQPPRLGLSPAYPPAFYGGPHQAPQSASPSNASSQGFAPAPPAGFYHGGLHHGAVAPTGGYVTHPPFAGQPPQYPYTTAPYSSSAPAPALSGAPLLPPQQQDLRQSQSASPQRYLSPDAAHLTQQQSPPNKHPMAAPPLPQTPANQPRVATSSSNSHNHNHHNHTAAAPSPQTPQSAGAASREQQKVSLLLDINVELLQEVHRLQADGKGGVTNVQQAAQMKAQGQPAELASAEYIDVLRRVKSNIAYLMPRAQNDTHRMPPGPEQMTAPAHMPQLQPKYDRLKELFPDWPGLASPKANGMNAAAATAAAIAAVPTRT